VNALLVRASLIRITRTGTSTRTVVTVNVALHNKTCAMFPCQSAWRLRNNTAAAMHSIGAGLQSIINRTEQSVSIYTVSGKKRDHSILGIILTNLATVL